MKSFKEKQSFPLYSFYILLIPDSRRKEETQNCRKTTMDGASWSNSCRKGLFEVLYWCIGPPKGNWGKTKRGGGRWVPVQAHGLCSFVLCSLSRCAQTARPRPFSSFKNWDRGVGSSPHVRRSEFLQSHLGYFCVPHEHERFHLAEIPARKRSYLPRISFGTCLFSRQRCVLPVCSAKARDSSLHALRIVRVPSVWAWWSSKKSTPGARSAT